MSIKVSEALYNFLHARKTSANEDLIDRWSIDMECQVNVAPANGEPVAGKRSTWSDGSTVWYNLRIPKNAATDPTWTDYNINYPFDLYAEGIGCTGWNWKNRRSLWFGFDFDSITSHAKGIGISDEGLAKVREAACALPYVQVRRSTGGKGIHLYVYLDAEDVETQNHTEHAALARCILGMMSAEVGFDFASQIDAAGHVMWCWHRKMTAENHGLEIIKPATKTLTAANLPANWRDHIEVVRGRRSKVRINQIMEKDQDPFEALVTSRAMVPLDDSHKAQIDALMRSGYTTLWVADHHLLQTHTCALQRLLTDQRKELTLVGIFKTDSQGKDRGTPNCFCFPLPNGAWRVFRFSPGVREAETWTQSEDGWTTCYFNRYPTLASAAKSNGGVEDENDGGFVFTDQKAAVKTAEALGQPLDLNGVPEDRRITLKSQKDGRLVVQIQRQKNDGDLPGWVDKKNKWVRVFDVSTDANDESEDNAGKYDNVVRLLAAHAEGNVGWATRATHEWVKQPSGQVKYMLQNLGLTKADAESVMGGAGWQPWWLVNLPFQDEYPGNRQWNRDAAQFSVKPAELSDDDTPYHPHWDMIFDHLGTELTPVLQNLDWAQQAGIKTGGDYLRAWVACAFRDPFEPSPYLFFFGSENCGKSSFYESLKFLVTKGVVQADHALGNTDFNGELAGAIICAVEERDISAFPGAHAKIKSWVTGQTIPIRMMRRDTYEQPNSTHWVQTANRPQNCPIFKGDTRVTMVRVPDLAHDDIIPKTKMKKFLIDEAPHFLYTLLNLELPPYLDRLRIPIVTTESKLQAAEDNRTLLEIFIDDNCDKIPDAKKITLKDFYTRFFVFVPASQKHNWSKEEVIKHLPNDHRSIPGTHNMRYINGLVWKTTDKDAEGAPQ